MRQSPCERLDERRIEALRGIVGFIHFCWIYAYFVGFLATGAENQRAALALLVVRAPTVFVRTSWARETVAANSRVVQAGRW